MDATLDVSGTVTFHEAERRFSGREFDKLLQEAQAQSAILSELDRELELSRDFLSKVRKLPYFEWLSLEFYFNPHYYFSTLAPSLYFCINVWLDGTCVTGIER